METAFELHPDWIEFLTKLQEQNIRFLVVSDFKKRVPDLDLWVDPSRDNADKLSAAIASFSCSSIEVSGETIASPSFEAIVMGGPPVRVNLFTFFERRSFSAELESAESFQMGNLQLNRPGSQVLTKQPTGG